MGNVKSSPCLCSLSPLQRTDLTFLFCPSFPISGLQHQSLKSRSPPPLKNNQPNKRNQPTNQKQEKKKSQKKKKRKGRLQSFFFFLRVPVHLLTVHSLFLAFLIRQHKHFWEMLLGLHITVWYLHISYHFSGWGPWGRMQAQASGEDAEPGFRDLIALIQWLWIHKGKVNEHI